MDCDKHYFGLRKTCIFYETNPIGLSDRCARYGSNVLATGIILDPEKPLVIRRARQPYDSFLAQPLAAGRLSLDPPGIAIAIGELFE